MPALTRHGGQTQDTGGACDRAATAIGAAGGPNALDNFFTFLLAGTVTDDTEVIGLRERTRSWRIALFLPLIAVPQVLVVDVLLNGFAR